MAGIVEEAIRLISESLKSFGLIVPLSRTIIVVIILFILFSLIIKFIEKRLLKYAKTKQQRTHIEVFTRLAKYIFLILLVISAIFTYTGSLTGIGLTFGLLSAAIGFALQRPITGIAAWLMVVFKRPFVLGDRIVIGDVKGDVEDITLSHIYLKEVGGFYGGEENTGRTILVPNYLIFDQNLINYSLKDDYVLGQVEVQITYESNFDKAVKLCIDTAKKRLKEFTDKSSFPASKKEPHIRVSLGASGVDIKLLYTVPFEALQQSQTDIIAEIHKKIMKMKDVEVAYPHMEVLHRKK